METLRYTKINTFLKDLNAREKRYLQKKLNKEILKKDVLKVNFTVNGLKVS